MNGLVGRLVGIGVKILPPTVHPMVVHFPIALLYLTLMIEILGYLLRPRHDRFFARASFWTLTLSLLAIVAAGAAGMVSEHFVKWSPKTSAMLSHHQRDAFFTGLFALIAWIVRLSSRFKDRDRSSWSVARTGRGRMNPLSSLFVLGAVVMISLTGILGGSMVYDHGVGILHVTRQVR